MVSSLVLLIFTMARKREAGGPLCLARARWAGIGWALSGRLIVQSRAVPRECILYLASWRVRRLPPPPMMAAEIATIVSTQLRSLVLSAGLEVLEIAAAVALAAVSAAVAAASTAAAWGAAHPASSTPRGRRGQT